MFDMLRKIPGDEAIACAYQITRILRHCPNNAHLFLGSQAKTSEASRALELLNEIERVEGVPLGKLSRAARDKYALRVANLALGRGLGQLAYNKAKGERLLKELRESGTYHEVVDEGYEQANRHVLTVTPYKTGRPSPTGVDPGLNSIIPLASNENPAGPSPLALQALAAVLPEIHRYPDDDGCRLKQALAEKHNLQPDNIILGHGATDVLEIIVRAFLSTDDEVISAHPSFPWFQILGQLTGARNVVVPLRNYKHDLEAMAAATTPRTKIIFIANPNNPTGTTVGPRQMQAFFERVPEQVVVVIDEAYVEYITGEKLDSLQYLSRGTVVVVRTFSTIGGLSGLRIGYGMADAGVIHLLERVRQPFNTTALAQIAALASLYDRRHILKSRKLVIQGKAFLYGEFARLGIDYVPTQANFVFVDFNTSVEPIADALLTRGFLIRPVLPTYARVTIGSPEQNVALVGALESILSGSDARGKRRDYGKPGQTHLNPKDLSMVPWVWGRFNRRTKVSL